MISEDSSSALLTKLSVEIGVVIARVGAVVSTRNELLSVTSACVIVALLPAASRIVPELSVRLLTAILIPLGSVSPAATV